MRGWSGRVAGCTALAFVMLAVGGCGGDTTTTVVRGADDVQVMSPEEVAAVRLPVLTTLPASVDSVDGAGVGATTVVGDTVPQNQDDRPPELRLFEAFGEFRSCLEDKGFQIEGDLLDPNNPAYQQPGYLDAVQTCAARSDIVSVLQEVQSTRASLTPEEVEQRNEVFKELQSCLEGKGWTVETRTSEIGLLEPAVFQNADGQLDERDINQCLSEQNLGG
jgi:hypothetical protein